MASTCSKSGIRKNSLEIFFYSRLFLVFNALLLRAL